MRLFIAGTSASPAQFAGTDTLSATLCFDNVVAPEAAGPRERFEAFARSVRDVLSQRWIDNRDTYARANPKRIYYLSMEFLIAAPLANNVTNLFLDATVKQAADEKRLDWAGLLEQEPEAGLGNADSGAWRPASSTRWRQCNCPPWVTA